MGEVTCLLGRNGVGKTTLLRCLMGLVPAREGQVAWEGRSLTGLRPHQRVRAGIAYVPQGREIFPRLTVEENLLMGLSRFSARDARTVPDFIYELFPVLREMKQRRGGDLSGGQQQQLAIGRALASQPTADPRRTHGRHPAFGDQGDRHGRPQPGGARRHGDPAGRAVLRLRRRTGRPIPGDGARRDRPAGPRPRHGERGRARLVAI
ncbi:ABC transporter family protein [Pseudomonas aeruginosa]|nr:ABC transporter family protein [Pseudomonas aeruginosa]